MLTVSSMWVYKLSAGSTHGVGHIPFVEPAIFLLLAFVACTVLWSYRNVSNRHEQYRETYDQVCSAVKRYESLYDKHTKD